MDKQIDSTSKADSESLPLGVYGYCATDNSGEEIEKKGQVAGTLEEYGAYFNQLTSLIADSLGFDEAESTIIFGKKENVICCEVEGVHYAATFKPKSSRREITDFFKRKGNDDEFFA
jgi:hypothetical protein